MKFLLSTLLAICFISCTENLDSSLLVGKWKLESWVNAKNDQEIKGAMDFTFSDDKRYEVDYGSEKEVGKYWTAGSYLHTLEDGKAEKKVLITTLNADSLAFEMNRAGTIEKVLLLKE